MRNVTLRHLKTIEAVCALGKLNLAAKELGLTSPAVTLQIQQVEKEIDGQLFDRTKAGMIPTEIGLAFLNAARSIHDQLHNLEDSINSIKGLGAGTLRLGVVSTGKYFAPGLMAAFSKEYPDIEMQLFIGNRQETIHKLKNHDVDIALMGRPPRDFDVRAEIFGDHPLVFVAPIDHPLANDHEISKERISAEKFLIREKGSGTRTSLEIFMSEIPEKLDLLGVEMGSNETIKQAVIAGLGIAFISAHTIEQELVLNRLVILDVISTPIRRQWFSVSRTDRSITPSMMAFQQFLRKKGGQYLPTINKIYPVQNIK